MILFLILNILYKQQIVDILYIQFAEFDNTSLLRKPYVVPVPSHHHKMCATGWPPSHYQKMATTMWPPQIGPQGRAVAGYQASKGGQLEVSRLAVKAVGDDHARRGAVRHQSGQEGSS